jgi:hypothetical protein
MAMAAAICQRQDLRQQDQEQAEERSPQLNFGMEEVKTVERRKQDTGVHPSGSQLNIDYLPQSHQRADHH